MSTQEPSDLGNRFLKARVRRQDMPSIESRIENLKREEKPAVGPISAAGEHPTADRISTLDKWIVEGIECHGPRLRSIIVNITRSVHDADDLLSDVVIRVAGREEPDKPGAFLASVARNLALDRYWENRRRQSLFRPLHEGDEAASVYEDPSEVVAMKEAQDALMVALDQLSSDDHEILNATYLNECRMIDVAKELGVGRTKAFELRRKALDALKELFPRESE
jgi:RNA polymerase sigma factor (sigma-70 family)